MKKFFSWKIIAILATTLLLGLFDAPNRVQETLIPFMPESITKSKINLGLDLQGGSQLDYKIDLRKVPEEDREAIIDGVTEVINRRVNNLGVSEPNIYTSEIAGEFHIIVELADLAVLTDEDVKTYLGQDKTVANLTTDEKKILSLEKAKATVGKTIQLEFKEKKETLDPQEKEKVKSHAQTALEKIKKGESFDVVGQEESLSYAGKVSFETKDYIFASEIHPITLRNAVTSIKTGETNKELIEIGGTFVLNEMGETQEDTALAIVQPIDIKEEIKFTKQVEASHVLVAWNGASNASEEITRTEEEAYERAKEALDKIKNQGKLFETVAQYYSDDPSNKDTGGRLTKPVTGEGTYVYDFEQTALALEKDGDVSEIIKTEFGYHIIKATKILNDVKEKQYKYKIIRFSTLPDPWKETALTGKNFIHADVQLDQFYQPYITIEFDDEGARLFEEITGRNVGKPVAIFVGGSLISSPRVNEKISGGQAQITGSFSQEEANNLARDLNTGAIPAPIVLTGEYTIGATLGQNALNVSLWAGLIGFMVLCLYMVLRYRAMGLLAGIALISYGVILIFLIKAKLHLGIALPISIGILVTLIYKTLNSKDSSGEKVITFILSCVVFFFITFLLKTGVVMTLAGVAGLVLSLGMAVDANILIFERIKEELKTGRSYTSAVEEGFFRAWSSIRDSNFSTLITCAVLFYFGSSIIRGFAFNLAAGVLISMFTAIVITKAFLHALGHTKFAKDQRYLCVNSEKKKEPSFKFMKNSKRWLTLSGTLIAISVLAMLGFGFRMGLDFTGGTLMEIKFEQEVSKTQLQEALIEIEDEMKTAPAYVTAAVPATEIAEPAETVSPATKIDEPEESSSLKSAETPETTLDLRNIQIIPTENHGFIIKTKYIDSDTHDQIIKNLESRFGSLEEPRFTTVGPTIGSTMKQKAMKAILVTIIVIILYVAFAFRKIPKEVSPWKFGISAIIALAHDIIIVTGFFVILGAVTGAEMDILFVTALLTILGYSVNDTIVVFDRIRENLKLSGRDEKLEDIADNALNQTLSRSFNTSFTTLITLTAIFIGSYFGGAESVRYFVLALIVGIIIGTYSSIFIASSGLVLWTKWSKKRADEKLRRG